MLQGTFGLTAYCTFKQQKLKGTATPGWGQGELRHKGL